MAITCLPQTAPGTGRPRKPPAVRGFTLIEMVIVIVLVGIMSAALTMLLGGPVRGYVDAERRAQLVDLADTALARMSREVRLALPNSIRVTTLGSRTALEFLRVIDGGRYRAAPQSGPLPGCGAPAAPGDPLEFGCADPTFDVLGQLDRLADLQTGGDCAGGDGDCMVVFNTGQSGGNAYAGDNTATLIGKSDNGGDDGSDRISVSSARLTGGLPAFPFASPGQRFYFVDTPVSFVCDTATGEVERAADYPISAVQSATPGGSTALLVNRVSGCAFAYVAGTNTRGGIATLRLALRDPTLGESIELIQQVQIPNLP